MIILVVKEFSFGLSRRDNIFYLSIADVKEYLEKDVILYARNAASRIYINKLFKKALIALSSYI